MALSQIRNFVVLSGDLATGGQPSEAQLREIAAAGFASVINLGLLDPRYCLTDEAGLVQSLGLRYRHIPVEFKTPRLEDLRQFFAAMEEEAGHRCFVHCAANYRVSAFVALYREFGGEWSPAQADAHIRSIWQPDEMWSAFIEAARRHFGGR